jgi:hypothetical protein
MPNIVPPRSASPLAAADERDDFEPVPGVQDVIAVLRTRHEDEVHFHGDITRLEAEFLHKGSQRGAVGEIAFGAVHKDSHGDEMSGGSK